MTKEDFEQWLDRAHQLNEASNDLFLKLEDVEFEDDELAGELLEQLSELQEQFEDVELSELAELVEQVAVIVENIKEGRDDFDPTTMDLLYDVVDKIEQCLLDMSDNEEPTYSTGVGALADKVDLFTVPMDMGEDDGETGDEDEESDDEINWSEMEYSELQQRAKERDIKANQSREELVEALNEQEEENSDADDSNEQDTGTDTTEDQDEENEPDGKGDYLYEPWDPSEFEQMVDDYLAESREQLTQLTNSLIELEQEQSPELIDSIFRVAHTLKGSSGMIGLEVLEDLAHSMEELLDEVRDGDREVTEELIDLLLVCNDKIEEILDTVENLEVVHVRVEHLLEGLDGLREGESIDVDEIREIEREQAEEQEEQTDQDDGANDDQEEDDSGSVSESIRVDIEKLDDVINLVGELVIDKGRLDQKIKQLNDLEQEIDGLYEKLQEGELQESDLDDFSNEMSLIRRAFQELGNEVDQSTDDMDRVISELQESVMRTRMVPVAEIFNKFPRLVRDLCRQTGKEVNLEIEGEDTEMDKTVIEKIGDPLMHIIRNAVDHGIESPEDRVDAGKSEEGTLSISAGYEGDLVVIEIEDDGGGIPADVVKQKALDKAVISEEEAEEMSDDEIHQLIFEPGFSTTEEVTETSGRGVGMDVVRSNIMDLNGSVDLESEQGKGTKFTIKLPLTLAIIQVLIVRIGEREFALPLSSVQENLRLEPEEIQTIGQQEVFELRGETLSLARLRNVLGYEQSQSWGEDIHPVVVAQTGNQRLGILVDELVQKQEIVIKDLGSILNNVQYASGATIMGDGSVVLIIDLGEIVHNAEELSNRTVTPSRDNTEESGADKPDGQSGISSDERRALIVEDTDTQRTMMTDQLSNIGFDVVEATNGREGLDKAREETFEFVMTDIEMPHMNGYELVENLRKMKAYDGVPILIMSALDEKIDRMRGFDAGADDYLEKPFGEEELQQKVQGLIREVS